jgi:hypothetical protein
MEKLIRGLGLASVKPESCIAALLTALCSGCLVTEPIDFPETVDYPPEILAGPNGPSIGAIINIIKIDHPTGWQFTVRVRDQNVNQPLEAHVRIKRSLEDRPVFEPQFVQPGDRPERTLLVQVDTNALTSSRCHQLEIAVSGSFGEVENGGFDSIPSGSTDLARASWWIWEGDTNVDAVLASVADSCWLTPADTATTLEPP